MTTREGETTEDNDFVEHLFTASTHDYLMFFTNTGRVYVERVHEIPDMGRAAKGRSIANLLELKADEKVAALIRILSKTDADKNDVTWSQSGELFFATQQGTVKKTSLNEFSNVRKGGIIAITIDQDDTLIDVKQTRGSIDGGDEGDDVVLITRDGMSIRFSESDVRSMGRSAGGVKGITLEKDDAVVALAVVVPDAALLVAGVNGIGKRTGFEEYLVQAESGLRKQSRGGKGRVTMKVGEKTGGVVGALTVRDHDEIMLITTGGQMVRIPVRASAKPAATRRASNSSIWTPATSSRPSRPSLARTRKNPPSKACRNNSRQPLLRPHELFLLCGCFSFVKIYFAALILFAGAVLALAQTSTNRTDADRLWWENSVHEDFTSLMFVPATNHVALTNRSAPTGCTMRLPTCNTASP
jgi:DNA gyrase/topoisomerase IV subunit A